MLRGQIILWWGSLATIPAGWQHCNGTNGTPDLRSKFIRGAFGEASVGVTGGSANHSHQGTGDGHSHATEVVPSFTLRQDVKDGRLHSSSITITTDSEDSRPPFHTLAYIMKMFDDAQSQLELPWPYAAKAIIQHWHSGTTLFLWITFRHKMDVDVKPPDAKWLIATDLGNMNVIASNWNDPWTMVLAGVIGAVPPAWASCEYDGPDENLKTAWDKQWEPWGAILSFQYPSPPVTLQFSTGPVPQDDVDVTGAVLLFLDCTGNDVVIGGFVGGVRGQIIHVSRLDDNANNATLEHHEGGGSQDIHLHAGLDETIAGEFGGWHLACDGSDWYDISHAKHV